MINLQHIMGVYNALDAQVTDTEHYAARGNPMRAVIPNTGSNPVALSRYIGLTGAFSSSTLRETALAIAISRGKETKDIFTTVRLFNRDRVIDEVFKVHDKGTKLTQEQRDIISLPNLLDANAEVTAKVMKKMAKKMDGVTVIHSTGAVYRVMASKDVVPTAVVMRDVLRPWRSQITCDVRDLLLETDYYTFTHRSYTAQYIRTVICEYLRRAESWAKEINMDARQEIVRKNKSKMARKAIASAVCDVVHANTGESPTYGDERDALETLADALNDSIHYTMRNRGEILNKIAANVDIVSRELTICDDCGSVVFSDEVSSADRYDVVCNSCIENNYYWSEYMDTYVHSDDATPVYESYRNWRNGTPDGYVASGYSFRSGYDYRDSEDAWFDQDIVYDCFPDEEDEDDGEGLSGYHDSYRNFVERWDNKSFVPLGVELEVYAPDRRAAVMSVRNAVGKDVYLERDGSLDDYHGFEIITQPLGKSEWAEFAPKLLDSLLTKDVCGYNHPDDNSYGIHISINREYLSPLQEARMSLFLTAEDNGDFVRVIAQRQRIYGGSDARQIGSFGRMMQNITQIGGINNGRSRKKIYGMGKYSPLNLKSDIAECRIFQSTLHKESFMKNLEFMWALTEWTSTKAATGSSWMHTDFVKWLAARPAADTDFPYLLAYLRRKEYRVKRGVGVIKNTWLELLPTATRRSKPVEELEEEAEAA